VSNKGAFNRSSVVSHQSRLSSDFSLPAPRFEILCPHLDLMNSFRNHRLRDFAVPMSTNWLLNDLAEARGSRDMSRLRLRDLKAAGRIECLGRGPGAKWRKRVMS
jgi:hypothetical protein